ncbi:MAG: transcriptional regulator [Oscillospiraceae bacterium]|nr:transcriptional regulator [Oscillospiraceae bacterium]
MDSLEPKKLALIRILQILKKYSDFDHPLTQEEIADHLEREYGIVIERKAISRNLSLLKEAGYEIESNRSGSYLEEREFEDAELHMLIDGVLSSKHIPAKHSKDLIEKLCNMSNQYFRSHVKNIFSVNDWSKTDNQAMFYNIELVDDAIERSRQIEFDYNKYGLDKKLHRTTTHRASPYQLILHNQRYYLMAFNERWHNIAYYRLDHITNMSVTDAVLTPIRTLEGYENGIDYKTLSTALPYMYTDKPQPVELIADIGIVDQIIDWFGTDIHLQKLDENRIKVTLKVSLLAMEFWAMQYLNSVEVTKPESLRQTIKKNLSAAMQKYQ